MVPGGVEAPGLEPVLVSGVLTQDAQHPAADGRQIRRTMVLSRPVLVFLEDHVERPVASVLYAPVAAHRVGYRPHLRRQAGDEVAHFSL